VQEQWSRSVVKYGGQGQPVLAIKLFQITSYVNDFQTFNNPGSWQPVGASNNLSFTFHFDTSLSSLMMWNSQNYPTTVFNERMWHFCECQNIMWPLLHIFRCSRPPPSGSAPLEWTTITKLCFKNNCVVLICVMSVRDVGALYPRGWRYRQASLSIW